MSVLQCIQLHKSGIASFVLPLAVLLVICRAFPVVSLFYLGAPLLLVLALPLVGKEALPGGEPKTIILLLIAFGTWAAITSAWSPYPRVSLTRAAYFLLISISPLLLGRRWRMDHRNDPFGFLLPANILVVLVSLYSLVTSSPEDAWTGGNALGFMGYAAHQNTLASALVFTIPSILYPLLKEASGRVWSAHHGSTGFVRLPLPTLSVYILLFLINLYLLLISASRAGVLTLVIMVFVFVLLSFSIRTAAAMLSLFISACVVLVYVSQPVRDFTFKTENTIGDSRIVNINATFNAAKHGGLLGIGYGISELPSDPRTSGHYEGEERRFVREKMIGALGLIEETGITGLLLFLLPPVYVLGLLTKQCLEASKQRGTDGFMLRSNAAMAIAVLVALSFHAQIEAWWVGVGSVQLPILYMVMSSES